MTFQANRRHGHGVRTAVGVAARRTREGKQAGWSEGVRGPAREFHEWKRCFLLRSSRALAERIRRPTISRATLIAG